MSAPTICPRCGTPLPADTAADACPACLLRLGALPSLPGQPTQSSWGRGLPPPPTPAEIAADFPQLEILEVLGQGGMGVVYKARQKSLDRIVALKILAVPPDAGPSFAERFAREARTLAGLSHPAIVTVYDFGQAGSRYYLLMEYVDGADLHRLIRAGQVQPRQALDMVSHICEALQFAHDAGVVHRDIKPENILVDRRGRVKIADFGLARLMGDPGGPALTAHGQVMGTAHYMAPEQLEHPLEVDHRADIYSLGVVLYELLTGELPIGKFDPPSRCIQVDVRVDEVVLRALEKEPGRRYQQASQVKTDVDGISSTLRPGSRPRAEVPARRVRSAWLWPVGALALVLAALGLFAWIRSFPTPPPAPPPAPQPEATVHSDAPTAPPIVVAAARGQREIVASLLDAGADIEAKAADATTPLIAAVDRRDPDLVVFLVSKGANVNARRQDGVTPLLIAVSRGDPKSADSLMRQGADVNAASPNGTTPLIQAADRRDPDQAAALIAKGANVNARREDGVTPLILAAARGDRKTVAALLRAGADSKTRAKNGRSALDEAVDRGDPEMVQRLVEAGK